MKDLTVRTIDKFDHEKLVISASDRSDADVETLRPRKVSRWQ
jgi:hypothetical protein